MGQVRKLDNINNPVISSSTSITLPGDNLITVGGQQYTLTNEAMDASTNGLGGLDVGGLAGSTIYNVFAVSGGGVQGLVASLASIPAGFAVYRQIAIFKTNVSTEIVKVFLSDSASLLAQQAEDALLESNYINGYRLQYINSTTTRFHPGVAASSDSSDLITLKSTMDKTLSSVWSPGNGGGALDTGLTGNNTYHCYVIKNPTTGDVDAILSLSPVAPVYPAGYSMSRRVGSVIYSGGLINWHQSEDDFFWNIPPATTVVSGIPANAAFSIPIPVGIEVLVKGVIFAGRAGTSNGDKALAITKPGSNFNAAGAPDISSFRGHTGSQYAASSFGADMKGGSTYFECMSNTSGTIEIDGAGTSSQNGGVIVIGWRDFRGKN